MVRLPSSIVGLLALSGCSLLFDATDLTEGGGEAAGPTSGGATSSGTIAPATSSSGAGGEGASSSTSTAVSSTGGGEGGSASTGVGDGGDGGGGSGPCGLRFCDTDGADAAFCFDFDGPDPLAGLFAWHPDSTTVTSTVEPVDDPVTSCPRAIASRVEEVGSEERAFAFVGFDVPLGSDDFVWAFAVQRLTSESDSSSNTIAQLSWDSGDVPCQILVQMRDTGATEGRVSVYTQGHDGMGWVAVGSASLLLPHTTLGAWTQVEVHVDLADTATVTLRADGLESSTAIDAMCGPTTTHYDLDVGHHFTNRVQSTVFDDLTLRLPGG